MAIPNVLDFCTIACAAYEIGISEAQLRRYLADGRLTTYTPRTRGDEVGPRLLLHQDVLQFRDARALARGKR